MRLHLRSDGDKQGINSIQLILPWEGNPPKCQGLCDFSGNLFNPEVHLFCSEFPPHSRQGAVLCSAGMPVGQEAPMELSVDEEGSQPLDGVMEKKN